MAKCGKFYCFCGKVWRYLWQNLGFQMAIFHDNSVMGAAAVSKITSLRNKSWEKQLTSIPSKPSDWTT